MANILITDLLEQSAYLLRSLLRGMDHNVSISICRKDAEAKLATGLFDVLMVDYCTVMPDNLAVGRLANDLLPGMPVVALTTQDAEGRLGGLDLAGILRRPIRGKRLREVMARAMIRLWQMSGRRAVHRVPVALPVEIVCGDLSFHARTADLSSRGMAVDASAVKLGPTEMDAIESRIGREGEVTARIEVAEGRVLSLKGSLAFFDRQRLTGGRTMGLSFDSLDEQCEVALAGIRKLAA